MNVLVALLTLASFASAEYVDPEWSSMYNSYGYFEKVGIPQAERIKAAEEAYLKRMRIVGGVPAGLGQYPHQAGLLSSIIGLNGTGVCGGSLVSANRVVTAAHCWFDGVHQAWRITVVLGSITIFSGGTRADTSVVAMHPNWSPALFRNDIAVIYLPNPVELTANIQPIALPSGSELFETFAGTTAIASGFGYTSDSGSIGPDQFLSHTSLNVITNSACSIGFPLVIQSSHMCTSGIGGSGTCGGDSGGPLIVNRNGRNILIGVTNFGSAFGCQIYLPSVFARVTSFIDFIQRHI